MTQVNQTVWVSYGQSKIRIWDYSGKTITGQLNVDETILTLLVIYSTNEVWAGCKGGKMLILNFKGDVQNVLLSHTNDVVALLEVDNNVWAAGLDSTIQVINKVTKKTQQVIKIEQGPVGSLTLFQNEVFVGTEDAVIKFSVKSMVELGATKPVKIGLISSIVLVPETQEFWASSSNDKRILIFDMNNFELKVTLDVNSSKVTSMISFGDCVWSCNSDHTIIIWDKKNHTAEDTIKECHTDIITSLAKITIKNEFNIWSGSSAQDGYIFVFGAI